MAESNGNAYVKIRCVQQEGYKKKKKERKANYNKSFWMVRKKEESFIHTLADVCAQWTVYTECK